MINIFTRSLLYGITGNQKQLCRLFSINLSKEHLTIKETCRKFAEAELKPIAAMLDKESKFPTEQITKMGGLGLLSIHVSEKWGGSGKDMLSVAIAVEEIARCCGSTGAIVSIHNILYASLVDRLGTDEQKTEFLRPFTRGTLGCFALSELDAGSDVVNLSTSAVPIEDYYVLNGTKAWVTSAAEAEAAVIFATIQSKLKHKGVTAFLVPLQTPGISLSKKEDKMGIRATSTCNIILENVKVPKGNILGEVGEGFKIAMNQLDKARIGIAAQAIGISQAALEDAVRYVAIRKSFGQTLDKFQAVKMRLAVMASRLEAARLLVWRAAILCNELRQTSKESSMAKLAASEAATFITHNAVQLLGAVGYVKDTPIERYYRDARVTEIYGGVSDVQKLVIGDSIIKEYS